jgi:acetylornithine deacetylase/succinyl-diaminopimelate desuccinylase-like protein
VSNSLSIPIQYDLETSAFDLIAPAGDRWLNQRASNLPRVEKGAAVLRGDDLGARAVDLLQRLIQIDTVNPPGNEAPAQELLAETLGDAGFECELLAAEAGRPNLVARLRGSEQGPTLCLLGHADTVPADRSEWSFDPWAGDVVNGEVRGRGAQDMKDQVAAEVAAAAALGSDGWRPRTGELLVVTTADEEMGAAAGAQWLCREHPEKVRSDFVLNEGGGVAFHVEGRRFYTLCVGEKGVFRFLIRAHGRAGHASVPALGDNALLKLAPALERLRDQPAIEPTPEAIEFLSSVTHRDLGADLNALPEAVERLRGAAPEVVAYLLEPMLRVTLTPTVARASEKANVIPSRAEILVDCRVPPGMGEAEVRDRAEAVLGDSIKDSELEFVEHVVGNRSPARSPLADTIESWLAEADPGAALVPMAMAGFSDSHWFRKAFDSAIVYGFCPQRELSLPDAAPLVHGADERAAVADVELAAGFYRHMAQEILG